MAAAAIAAAAAQKDLGWYKTGKVAKKPKLTDPVQLYSLCEVISSEGQGPEADLTVKCIETYYDNPMNFLPQGGGMSKGEEQVIKRKDFPAANPPHQDMVKDLGELDNMHEPALLHCIGARYCGGDKNAQGVKAYYSTYIGPICIATNPFAPQKAWVNTFERDDYVNSKEPVITNKKLQPHPWAVGDMAYRELLEEGNNQAVLICGESGAGKTECCKFVLDFLVQKKESLVENLTDKLLATNDPLEAFGNAKTVNNDNSSRFAKCMQIAIDKEGRVCGAEIQTSLLEKARSCAFFVQERNFHIFYMMVYYRHVKCSPEPGEKQDTDTSDAQDLLGDVAYNNLMEADKYDNIKQGDVMVDTEGQRYRERFQASDIDWFKRVIRSFRDCLGYVKKDTDEMMALLTGCLHLGQLQYADEDASEVESASDGDIAVIAECFGISDKDALKKELVLERIMMGGSLIDKTLNKAKAMASRDAIIKSVFQTMFADIVEHCNISITGETEKAQGRVGVLDIFGFERMQFNSLEQICINYTNEKLHQTFINEVFESEKKVYADEGLDPGAIQFTDNAMVLEMTTGCNPHDTSGKSGASAAEIKTKMKKSLFGILDDVCKQEKNNGVTYCERVVKQWTGAKDANGPLFEEPKFGSEEFTVVHFAGPVKYGTTEVDKGKFLPPSQWEKAGIDPKCPVIDSFLTKNKDKVPQSLLDFFNENCSNEYYLGIFSPEREVTATGRATGGESTGASAAKTIVSKFNIEIEAFFKQLLTGANPKFIRCINPRPKGIPAPKSMGERFNLQRVLVQLRYTGILDTVRVRASGFIIRKKYEDFAPAYIHPCNMLTVGGAEGEPHALQGDMNDLDFAEKIKGDKQLATDVIRAMFANPEYKVPPEEVLEGKTMIFVKKLSTVAQLNKRKEEMMAEVIKREMAKMRIVALSQRWLHVNGKVHALKTQRVGAHICNHCVADKVTAAKKLQATWGRWVKWGEKSHRAIKKVWQPMITELMRRHAIMKQMLSKAEDESQWAVLETGDGERWLEEDMGKKWFASPQGQKWHTQVTERKAEEARQAAAAQAALEKHSATKIQCVFRGKVTRDDMERQRQEREAYARAFAWAYALGFKARKDVAPIKATAIEEAKAEGLVWKEGKGSLLKKRKKKVVVERTAGGIMEEYARASVADGLFEGVHKGAVKNVDKLPQALMAGAAAAATAAPTTTDAAKQRLSTRKFIKGDLQRNLVGALKLLHLRRPPPHQVHDFLVAALHGKDPPAIDPTDAAPTGTDADVVYEYFKTNGVFALLKPALLALDKHRPADPSTYLATFLGETVTHLAD